MKLLLVLCSVALLATNALALDFKSLETIYYPNPSENLNTYFLNGIPFSVLLNDSSYILLYIETGNIASNHYAKLWILYQNLAYEPYLLEPLNQIKLTIETEKETYAGLIPMPPSQIMKSIDNEKNANMIIQAIGGALKTISTEMSPEATITNPSGEVYKIDDKQAGDKVVDRTLNEMRETSYMYKAFKSSINNGILRRNTIFQNNSVTGNVYFHIGDVDLRKCKKITLFLSTIEGIKVIDFIPKEGE